MAVSKDVETRDIAAEQDAAEEAQREASDALGWERLNRPEYEVLAETGSLPVPEAEPEAVEPEQPPDEVR